MAILLLGPYIGVHIFSSTDPHRMIKEDIQPVPTQAVVRERKNKSNLSQLDELLK